MNQSRILERSIVWFKMNDFSFLMRGLSPIISAVL